VASTVSPELTRCVGPFPFRTDLSGWSQRSAICEDTLFASSDFFLVPRRSSPSADNVARRGAVQRAFRYIYFHPHLCSSRSLFHSTDLFLSYWNCRISKIDELNFFRSFPPPPKGLGYFPTELRRHGSFYPKTLCFSPQAHLASPP